MKSIYSFLIVVFLICVSSCIKEDRSDCPPSPLDANVTLYFHLGESVEPTEEFINLIHSVDLLIYDNQGVFLDELHIEKSRLRRFQGVHLKLPPGEYKIVSWANKLEQSTYEGVKTAESPYITYKEIFNNRVSSTDEVYYAENLSSRSSNIPESLTLEVPEDVDVEEDVFYELAHKIIKVFVEGYTENEQEAFPIVGIDGLNQALNLFDREPIADMAKVESYQQSQEVMVLGRTYGYTQSTTFWFDLNKDEDIDVNIYSPTSNELVYSITLKRALRLIGASMKANRITLLIRFKDGNVEIVLPNWSSEDIGWN